jgi:signal peptidase II
MTQKQWKSLKIPGIIIILTLIADQILKIWVKTHMQIGDSIPVFGNWFQLYFVENEGMAFGMAFGGEVGKIINDNVFRFG